MYTLVSAYGVSNAPQARWGTVDLSTITIAQVFQQYRQIYLTLTNPTLLGNVFVDMNSLVNMYEGFNGTVGAFLTYIGSNTLPTISSIPTPNPKYVKYADAFSIGYKAQLVNNNGSLNPNTPDNLTMLRLSRSQPATDMSQVYKYCLVSINGFFYITQTDGNYLYVKDAGKSSLKSRQNQVGLLNFDDLGALEIIPITPAMIFNQGSGSYLKDRAYITLPNGITSADKTPILVMGGYLNFLSNKGFFQVGNNTFGVDHNLLHTLNRYYESLPYIDYSYLGLTGTSNNPEQTDLTQFFSDAILTSYMTGSNSFIVLVDTAELFTNKIFLRDAKLPGMFVSTQTPTYPLITGYGRLAEYWKTYEDGQWSLTVQDNSLNNFIFDTCYPSQIPSASSQRVPYDNYQFSKGYLLEIGKDF